MSDLQLLREVLRWARANGWGRDWLGPCGGLDRGTIRWESDRGYVSVDAFGCLDIGGMCEVEISDLGLRCAVDVLAAVGVLPATFSSAYAAGQAAALEGATEQWGIRRSDGTVVAHRTEASARDSLAVLGGQTMHRLVTPWQPAPEMTRG